LAAILTRRGDELTARLRPPLRSVERRTGRDFATTKRTRTIPTPSGLEAVTLATIVK